MQSREELENWYETEDPWAYQNTPDDLYRKNFYLAVLEDVGPYFSKALDIGAGEGWVTKDLPAVEKHAFELSDAAASRLPNGVERVERVDQKYDLILATGVMYEQYDHIGINQMIHNAASNTHETMIMIAGIKDWLIPYSYGMIHRHYEIPYREYQHVITIWEYLP